MWARMSNEFPTEDRDEPTRGSSPQSQEGGQGDAKILVQHIEEHLTRLGAREEAKASRCTIFRVPDHILGKREDLFRPQIVSIGPYVYKDITDQQDFTNLRRKFQMIEVVKGRFLCDLKMQTSEDFEEDCVKNLFKLEPEIRECYYQSFDLLTSENFTWIIFLDGIFIIQYFMKWKRRSIYSTIGTTQWNFAMILHDLLLLENQIPFFVLQTLFDVFVRCKTNRTDPSTPSSDNNNNGNLELLTEILDGFKAHNEDIGDEVTLPPKEIKHLLHLYHHCYISKKIVNVQRPIDLAPGSILSASKLGEAGVKFKKKKEASSFLDVTFKDGVLEIPFMSVHERMTYKFANLIALEQSRSDMGQVLTSYAMFMDKIIDTSEDVDILRYEGILENMLASNEDVALFFNQLCSYAHLNIKKHYLAPLFRDVDTYCKSRWHEQRAWLVRNYFSNPWVFISLVGAVIILILTFLQTYFSVYSYFRPP